MKERDTYEKKGCSTSRQKCLFQMIITTHNYCVQIVIRFTNVFTNVIGQVAFQEHSYLV